MTTPRPTPLSASAARAFHRICLPRQGLGRQGAHTWQVWRSPLLSQEVSRACVRKPAPWNLSPEFQRLVTLWGSSNKALRCPWKSEDSEGPRGQQVCSSWASPGTVLGHLRLQRLPLAGSLSSESTAGASALPGGLEEAGPSWLQGDRPRGTGSAGSRLLPDSRRGWGSSPARYPRICLTRQGCREGEDGLGGGRGGAAGVDQSLDGAVGPTAGQDAAPQAVRRSVDFVPRMELLPAIGADASCWEQSASITGQGRGQEPRAPGARRAVHCSPFAA